MNIQSISAMTQSLISFRNLISGIIFKEFWFINNPKVEKTETQFIAISSFAYDEKLGKTTLLTNFWINQPEGLDNCLCLFHVKIGSIVKKKKRKQYWNVRPGEYSYSL